jgi:hypothetical protein
MIKNGIIDILHDEQRKIGDNQHTFNNMNIA